MRIFNAKADALNVPLTLLRGRKPTTKQIRSVVNSRIEKQAVSIEPLDRSTLHHVFRIRTAKQSYILRARASKTIQATEFLVDQWAYQTIGSKGLPSLKVHAADIQRNIVPFDYELMGEAPGKWLYKYKSHPPQSTLEDLGRLAARYHRIRLKGFGLIDIDANGKVKGRYNSWSEYLLLNASGHINILLQRNVITDVMAKDIRRAFKNTRALQVTPVLLHGDLANHNVFTDGKRVTALIDWEDVLSGDPLYDIAYYKTGCFNNPDWFDAFIKGYRREQSLPANFEKILWLYYLRISVMKAVIRKRFPSLGENQLPNPAERIVFALSKLSELGV